MADVFVSYKREDRADIEPLVRLLEDEGLDVWWDPDLIAGDRFDEIIADEIEKAACVIVAWSKRSINAIWIRDEASVGRDRGILVPLSLDGVLPPLGFRQIQTPNLSNWAGDVSDPRLQQLIAGVHRLVRTRRPSGSALDHPPRAAPPRALTLSRRHLFLLGAAGITSAAGAWIGMSQQGKKSLPPVRQDTVDVVTIDSTGRSQAPQSQAVHVFDLPMGGVAMQFSIIPEGRFQIGSPPGEGERQENEGSPRLVGIRSFAIGRTAVTQAQWRVLVDAAPDPVTIGLPPNPSFFHGDDLPVETVSWNQAEEFCRRLSGMTGLRMRLPSEAEWEYACRARTTSPFYFGPTITTDLANYCGTGGAVRGTDDGVDISSTTYGDATYGSGAYGEGPTGTFRGSTVAALSFPPNRFGLYQTHGNVWEHCADTGPVDYRLIPTDGRPHLGAEGAHVIRGGSWSHNPAICRSAYRDAVSPDNVGWDGRIGLRVVCELDAG